MKRFDRKGRIYVIDGGDGTGKNTQRKLLEERFLASGFKAKSMSFPQYGEKSAGCVENYLKGEYGTLNEVGPYPASIFYSIDRFDAAVKKLLPWMEEDGIWVLDRYISANIGHQAGKIKDPAERKEYIRWLMDLEYRILGIPQPEMTLILNTLPEIAQKRVLEVTDEAKLKEKSFLGGEKADIHEKDLEHQKNTYQSYLLTADEFPEEYRIVNCMEGGHQLSPEKVHKKIWELVSQTL